MPSAFEPLPTEGRLIATTPANPTSRPALWSRDGICRTNRPATSATISGVAALIMPASDESIHCWATANSTNGIAIQVMPTRTTCAQSERGTGARAAGRNDSARRRRRFARTPPTWGRSGGARSRSAGTSRPRSRPRRAAWPSHGRRTRRSRRREPARPRRSSQPDNALRRASMRSGLRPNGGPGAAPRGSRGRACARPRRAGPARAARRRAARTSATAARR